MKRLFTIVCCAAVLAACGGNNKKSNTESNEEGATAQTEVTEEARESYILSFTINGDLSGLPQDVKTIQIRTADSEQCLDVELDDAKCFAAEVEAFDGESITILAGNDALVAFACDGNDLTIKSEDGIITAEGSPLYDKMVDFTDTASALYQNLYTAQSEEELEQQYQELLAYIRDYIDENIDNVLALEALSTYAGLGADDAECTEIFAKINPKYAHLKLYKSMKNTMPGAEMIDLTLKDGKGNEIRLSDITSSGKWVLVDFWATWCGPCRGEIPYLVEAYTKFAPKGLEIYGVSFDRNGTEERWQQFIKENNMRWINVWGTDEEGGWSVAEPLNVAGIPANFLYSPEGKLVAKNLRGEDIEKTLAKYIK